MTNLTKVMVCCCLIALILLIAAIYFYNVEGFPKYLVTVLALIGGGLSLTSALFGFVYLSDKRDWDN